MSSVQGLIESKQMVMGFHQGNPTSGAETFERNPIRAREKNVNKSLFRKIRHGQAHTQEEASNQYQNSENKSGPRHKRAIMREERKSLGGKAMEGVAGAEERERELAGRIRRGDKRLKVGETESERRKAFCLRAAAASPARPLF